MDYKTRLQANNTELENNNTDLQSILNTINTLPNASESINLDSEITEQTGLIDQIQIALDGKAANNLDTSDATAAAEDIIKDKTAYVNGVKVTGTHVCPSGGGSDVSLITTTITEADLDGYPSVFTINELIGAKHFIIQGNSFSSREVAECDIIYDRGLIHSILYLNGEFVVNYIDFSVYSNQTSVALGVHPSVDDEQNVYFDETTGTIDLDDSRMFFGKLSIDNSNTGVVYTVYRLG